MLPHATKGSTSSSDNASLIGISGFYVPDCGMLQSQGSRFSYKKRPQRSPGGLSHGLFEGPSLILIHALQIKNIISTAYALASREGNCVAMSHLEVAIAAGKDFECDLKRAGQVGNLQSYA